MLWQGPAAMRAKSAKNRHHPNGYFSGNVKKACDEYRIANKSAKKPRFPFRSQFDSAGEVLESENKQITRKKTVAGKNATIQHTTHLNTPNRLLNKYQHMSMESDAARSTFPA